MMRREDVEAALDRAERAVESGRGLGGTGFWRAVDVARADRELTERYADRIAAIDRRAFERGVRLRVPLVVGLVGLLAATVFGVVAVIASLRAGTPPRSTASLLWRSVDGHIDSYRWPGFVPAAFLLGFAALIIGTHSLTHWVVGRLSGIRFTHVFLGGPKPPRPGVKTDYASYLRAAPRRRALMHASGAVVTKLLPFALLPFSFRLYQHGWPWVTWILLAVGFLQIVTDAALSTKVSDWMKVRRELRAARDYR